MKRFMNILLPPGASTSFETRPFLNPNMPSALIAPRSGSPLLPVVTRSKVGELRSATPK